MQVDTVEASNTQHLYRSQYKLQQKEDTYKSRTTVHCNRETRARGAKEIPNGKYSLLEKGHSGRGRGGVLGFCTTRQWTVHFEGI
jgi:hypothetical protein